MLRFRSLEILADLGEFLLAWLLLKYWFAESPYSCWVPDGQTTFVQSADLASQRSAVLVPAVVKGRGPWATGLTA